MKGRDIGALPGGDLVARGLDDLARGRVRAESLLVSIGAPELALACPKEAQVYLTGGGSAVLLGWRATTVDLDLKIAADEEGVLKAIPHLKEELQINVELASPDQFIPPLPGWRERSLFIATGSISRMSG